jgi:hypothetical protein
MSDFELRPEEENRLNEIRMERGRPVEPPSDRPREGEGRDVTLRARAPTANGRSGVAEIHRLAYEARVQRLQEAPDLQAALGCYLLDERSPTVILGFAMIARAYRAGGTSYPAISKMLKDKSSVIFTDQVGKQVKKAGRDFPRSAAGISRVVTELETVLGIPLLHLISDGRARDRLTEHGEILADLIEAYISKLVAVAVGTSRKTG